MYQDSSVTRLLECAARGRESAWREIVDRFSSLIYSMCHRYGISGDDIDDVTSEVWLKLLTNATTIRDPNALPGWLRTTTRNECLGLLRAKTRQFPAELVAEPTDPDFDANLLDEERRRAAQEAIAHLSTRDRALLSLLFSDPPVPYTEISSTLGIPVGAIGPTRARCLARARRTPAIAALTP